MAMVLKDTISSNETHYVFPECPYAARGIGFPKEPLDTVCTHPLASYAFCSNNNVVEKPERKCPFDEDRNENAGTENTESINTNST